MSRSLFVDFTREVSRVARRMLAGPLRWRLRDWSIALVTVASTCAAYVEKRPLQALLGGDGRGAFARISQIVWCVGDGDTIALLALVLAVVGGRLPRALETSFALGAGGVCCFALTKFGQFVLAEDRPLDGGAMHWLAFGGHGVSGHASAAALLFFPIFASTHGRSRALRVGVACALVGWALLVAWTRVWTNNHHVWNVIAGFAVGAYSGHVAAPSFARREKRAVIDAATAPRP